MILFQSDYLEGAHPLILERLVQTNMEQTPGYGADDYCKSAADKIRSLCQADAADVHFMVGGTQSNLTVIGALLRSYQGVICADTGHINVHETGAIEATGHKVLGLPCEDGKLTALQVKECYNSHMNDANREHIVQPGMVYISNPTELGTIYTRMELEALYKVCNQCGLYLFMDGARLGYGLTAPDNDLTMADIARNCDVFYIGGTKVGALFGEAIVISNPALQKDFRYYMKQRGGMLAKGRLLGLQFDTLFTDDLYFRIAGHAIELAEELRSAFKRKGIAFLVENHTNQLFPVLHDEQIAYLGERFGFSYERRVDECHSAVRFCTSWATKAEDVQTLIEAIENL